MKTITQKHMKEVVCACTIRSNEYSSDRHEKNDRKQYNTDDDDATVSTETHIPMNGTQINVCCWLMTYRIVPTAQYS
jgi:hypothetical protein